MWVWARSYTPLFSNDIDQFPGAPFFPIVYITDWVREMCPLDVSPMFRAKYGGLVGHRVTSLRSVKTLNDAIQSLGMRYRC